MQNKIINYCQHKLKILGNFLIFAHIEGRPKPYLIRPIRFCGSYGGASEAPPKLSRKESSLTPCCYIAFVSGYIDGSHPKILKSQNLRKISGFQSFVKLRFRITLTSEKLL